MRDYIGATKGDTLPIPLTIGALIITYTILGVPCYKYIVNYTIMGSETLF